MNRLRRILATEPDENPSQTFQAWAVELLQRAELHAFGCVCRFVEIEFYYHSTDHPDPFTHCSEAQGTFLSWYLHRTGSGLRSGSFKGIDLTLGRNGAHGGILVRSLETQDGQIVNGPSLCVDALISMADVETVSQLHEIVEDHCADDDRNPLRLQNSPDRGAEMFDSARVGLSLKALGDDSAHLDYILRRYRFLTHPRDVKKGRAHVVLALHRDGAPAERIREVTGSPMTTIRRYIAWADSGTGAPIDASFSPTSAQDLCNLSHALESASRAT